MRPLVSVVMPVYNGAGDVRRAVSSIFDQTFRDFELIVVNDGSQDDTAAVLASIAKSSNPRLRVVHLTRNVGAAAALNHGIGLAQGDYIARHDHDDISRPTRLEQQVRFMQAHPECGLLGTRSEIWAADEPTDRGHFHPLENPVLQFALLFDNYFVHSSVLIPKRVLNTVGLYSTDPLRQPPEDFELWSRIARHYEEFEPDVTCRLPLQLQFSASTRFRTIFRFPETTRAKPACGVFLPSEQFANPIALAVRNDIRVPKFRYCEFTAL